MLAIIACIVITVWLLPLCIKAKIDKKAIVRIVLGLLIGAVPVALTAAYLNIMIGATVFGGSSLTIELYCLLNSLSVGLVEEASKLTGALLCVLLFRSERKTDYILAFGAVGAGFEITETFAYADNIITSLPRIVLALHVVWLLYDGANYFGAKNGRPSALVKSYLSTVILHALFDCGIMMLKYSDIRDSVMITGFPLAVIGIVANIIFVIKTMKMVRQAAEPAADVA